MKRRPFASMNLPPRNDDLHQQFLQITPEQTPSHQDSGLATERCVIYLGDLTEPCILQPCQHTNFDFLCLVTWLEKQPTCPLCKSHIHQVQYGPSENGEHEKVYKIPELSSSQDSTDSNPRQQPLSFVDDEITRRRRSIYQNNLYSLHVGFYGRKVTRSRYKQLLPKDFSNDAVLESRAKIWLSREVRVFEFLYTNVLPHHPVHP
jgi:hypothetical protein